MPGFPRLYAAASLKLRETGADHAHAPARFPRLYAAASLKRRLGDLRAQRTGPFSAALCRGLIEASSTWRRWGAYSRFSAALCRGLIEARPITAPTPPPRSGFPRLYAAASLKRQSRRRGRHRDRRFSAALCRGLIEALRPRRRSNARGSRFSAALCRGLIEARRWRSPASSVRRRFPRLYAAASLKRRTNRSSAVCCSCFPRLYAAASLKPAGPAGAGGVRAAFSAALCRGLIEARDSYHLRAERRGGFPRLYAAASLKPGPGGLGGARPVGVFRGFMPRPH